MGAKTDGELDGATASEASSSSHISGLRPPAAAGQLRPPAAAGQLEGDDLDELAVEADDEVEDVSGAGAAGGQTGVHRRASLPPPVPQDALSQRPSRAPTAFPGAPAAAGGTGVHRVAVPPPPPPPMPADFAALRSQLQRANSRCHELLCERARLEKQLSARDRALDALRLQNADLARVRADARELEALRRELSALKAGPSVEVSTDGGPRSLLDAGTTVLSNDELDALRADREALRALRREAADFEAMRIELERLRETQSDVERLRAEHAELVSLRRVRDDNERLRQRLAALEGQRNERAGQMLAELEQALEQAKAEAAQALQEAQGLRDAAERLGRQLEEARARAIVGPGLGDITGIGPTFQKRLTELGVDVAAVASWSEADVERIAIEIRTQPARIARQRWVEQARALLA